MRVITFLTIFLFLTGINLKAQQIDNAGFENWENAGTVSDEPVEWSSIKTSDGGTIINNAAPLVWGKSTDAHTGSFSVELTNVLTLGTIVATGIMTNGRVHAEFNPGNGYIFTNAANAIWNTPLTVRPDSIAVWVKYTPQGSDTAQVKVLLHTADGTLPPTQVNQANWVGFAQINIPGTVSSWTRYVMPFMYFSAGNPEYVLMILTAGAGTSALAGSKALFDDVELIYNASSIGAITADKALIYTSGTSLFLDKLPPSYFNATTLEIVSITGAVVYSQTLTSSKVTINNKEWTDGLYILHIRGQEVNYTQKINFNLGN